MRDYTDLGSEYRRAGALAPARNKYRHAICPFLMASEKTKTQDLLTASELR